MPDERGDESLGTCRAPFLHHHLHQLPPGLGTPSRAQPVRRKSKPPAKQLPTYLPTMGTAAADVHALLACVREPARARRSCACNSRWLVCVL
jgi:hypothetical protein